MNPLLEQKYLNRIKECKENARRYYDAFVKFADAAAKLKKMKTVGVSEPETKKEREGVKERAGFERYIGDTVMRKDATYFDVKVSQLLSRYYGESSKIMSTLFEVAKEEAPSVVFIDEFDSIALSRGAGIDEESMRVLSTLLAELDGLSSKASDKKFVLVVAATNTPDAIDEALMSRFGKKIEIPLPDYDACKEILRIHTERKDVGLEDDSLYDKLARYSVEHEMSGRDIKFMCTEAIWRMLDEMNPGLEKLAERELREGDFEIHWRG